MINENGSQRQQQQQQQEYRDRVQQTIKFVHTRINVTNNSRNDIEQHGVTLQHDGVNCGCNRIPSLYLCVKTIIYPANEY